VHDNGPAEALGCLEGGFQRAEVMPVDRTDIVQAQARKEVMYGRVAAA